MPARWLLRACKLVLLLGLPVRCFKAIMSQWPALAAKWGLSLSLEWCWYSTQKIISLFIHAPHVVPSPRFDMASSKSTTKIFPKSYTLKSACEKPRDSQIAR